MDKKNNQNSSTCSKCRQQASSLIRIFYWFKCGLCKDYENGFGDRNPFGSSSCGCPAICWECREKQCGRCGNVKNGWGDDFAANCKICKRINMLEKIDGSDTDGEGNWIDACGKIISSCEECVDCGMKTVCRDCALKKQRITEYKNCEKCHQSLKLNGSREWINNWKICKDCIRSKKTQTPQPNSSQQPKPNPSNPPKPTNPNKG